MSGLPAWLVDKLPEETAASWEIIAPLVPEPAYLGGGTALTVHLRHRVSQDLDFFFHEPVDLSEVRTALEGVGDFAVTTHQPGTLNGQFNATKVQFLAAIGQKRLEEPTPVAGMPVAGLSDILAMKVKAIGDRGELRDYFDLMMIEQQTGRTIEEGLGLYLTRYGDTPDSNTLKSIIFGLGHLDDVLEDELIPVKKRDVENYWTTRQPQIVRNISREPLAASLPPAPAPPDPPEADE